MYNSCHSQLQAPHAEFVPSLQQLMPVAWITLYVSGLLPLSFSYCKLQKLRRRPQNGGYMQPCMHAYMTHMHIQQTHTCFTHLSRIARALDTQLHPGTGPRCPESRSSSECTTIVCSGVWGRQAPLDHHQQSIWHLCPDHSADTPVCSGALSRRRCPSRLFGNNLQ